MTVILVVLAAAGGVLAGYLFGWRRGYWRGYDTAWYRREDSRQPRRPRSMGDAPGTTGGEQ